MFKSSDIYIPSGPISALLGSWTIRKALSDLLRSKMWKVLSFDHNHPTLEESLSCLIFVFLHSIKKSFLTFWVSFSI